MKEWLTASEIAAEALPDLPGTKAGILLLADREGWNDSPAFARPRSGRGGGTEYSIQLLPTLAQLAYRQKHMRIELPVSPEASPAPSAALNARAALERDARLAIVGAYLKMKRGLRFGQALASQIFVDRYNAGSLQVEPWVRETVAELSKRTLIRWVAAKRNGQTDRLAVDRGAARKGTGVLDTANGGALKRFVLALIASQPHLSAYAVRTQCRAEFGDVIKALSKGLETSVAMPPVRTFQHQLKVWKETHRVELTKLTNPDLYRSTMAPAGVGTLRRVSEANQLWQIDASPVDALCTDGRHTVYVCLDIATRRMVLLVARTPRASAVALLIRKAILAWGVPEVIKTDNGSDFTARDTTRLFASLGIEAETSEAYSPQQKGHVERAIGTFQREVGPLLPGFIGHSVADRKAIETRKSFAQRLGETEAETFGVAITGAQLQGYVDQWATLIYAHRPHAGLKDRTPSQAALSAARSIRMVDERALDLLLMPVAGSDGRRTVTKFGVRIDHYQYLTTTILPGTNVFVRQDPADAGRIYIFEEDGGVFLGTGSCPELSGLHPETMVKAAKEIRAELVDNATRQIKADMRRIAQGPALIERALNVARRDEPNVIALPPREERHSTPQIAAALEAMGERLNPTRPLDARAAAEHRRLIDELTSEDEAGLIERTDAVLVDRLAEIEAARTASLGSNVERLPETPKQRYRRAVAIRLAVDAGTGVDTAEAMWFGGYEASAEYRAQRAMHEDFGDAYLS